MIFLRSEKEVVWDEFVCNLLANDSRSGLALNFCLFGILITISRLLSFRIDVWQRTQKLSFQQLCTICILFSQRKLTNKQNERNYPNAISQLFPHFPSKLQTSVWVSCWFSRLSCWLFFCQIIWQHLTHQTQTKLREPNFTIGARLH